MERNDERVSPPAPGAIADLEDMLKLVQSAAAQASDAEEAVAAAGPALAGSAGESGTLAALALQIQDLSIDVPSADVQRPFRIVVATDWSSATLPYTVLRAYQEVIPAEAAVDLVFAVPGEPTEVDGAAVNAILEGIDGELHLAGVRVESFAEASSKPCFAAIVSTGNTDALMVELGQFLTHLHQLALVIADPDLLAQQVIPADGPNSGLAARLARFAAV